MDALVAERPKLIQIPLYILLAIAIMCFSWAIPVYADYFSGQSGSAYFTIGSSATSASHPLIGTSTTVDSYLSIGESWTYWTTVPSIQANSASAITMSSARLNAQIISDGGDNCSVRFGLDTVSHAVFTDYPQISAWVDSYHSGSKAYLDVTGLIHGMTYYYRAQVKNSYGTVTSTNEVSFTTIATIGNAINLRGNPTATSIILTWEKASGSTHTIIRYRTDAYPTLPTDGTDAYSGTGSQCTVSGLTAGQVYYFTAWGYTNPLSPTVASLAMSTLAADIPSGEASDSAAIPSIPTLPANINQLPDPSAFNLEPFTSIINYFNNATGGLGMPINNLWESLTIFGIVVVGLLTYVRIKVFLVAFFVVVLLSGVGVGLHLVQAYLVVLEIIVGMGVWAIEKYLQ